MTIHVDATSYRGMKTEVHLLKNSEWCSKIIKCMSHVRSLEEFCLLKKLKKNIA